MLYRATIQIGTHKAVITTIRAGNIWWCIRKAISKIIIPVSDLASTRVTFTIEETADKPFFYRLKKWVNFQLGRKDDFSKDLILEGDND